VASSVFSTRMIIACLAITAACASGGGSAPASDEGALTAVPAHVDRAIVTDAELAASTETAYDFLQRDRPEYLRKDRASSGKTGRGTSPTDKITGTTADPVYAGNPVVVTNGRLLGPIDELRSIPASRLSQIKFYSVDQAKLTFGMQFKTPVIEITYR
jgi:hypothetical protein